MSVWLEQSQPKHTITRAPVPEATNAGLRTDRRRQVLSPASLSFQPPLAISDGSERTEITEMPSAETPAAPISVSNAASQESHKAAPAEVIEPPHFGASYSNNRPPNYPLTARKLGLQGTVVLRVEVTSDGVPRQMSVLKSSGARILDESALRAVQQWTFVPARRGGEPIALWMDVPIRFDLRD